MFKIERELLYTIITVNHYSTKTLQWVALKVKLSPPKHVIVVLGLTLFITICYVTLCNHLAG